MRKRGYRSWESLKKDLPKEGTLKIYWVDVRGRAPYRTSYMREGTIKIKNGRATILFPETVGRGAIERWRSASGTPWITKLFSRDSIHLNYWEAWAAYQKISDKFEVPRW